MKKEEDAAYPRGVKWTKQRKCVYQVLADATEPLTAQQIFNLTDGGSGDDSFALSTIYRILAAFEEHEIVEKTTWMDGSTVVYELNRGIHTHYAVCLKCHKRIPLHSCPFMSALPAHRHDAADKEELADFDVVGHKLELYGYCRECKP